MINKSIQYKNEKTNTILNVFLRIIFGFLVPFVVINGLIYFLYTAHPTINIITNDNAIEDNGTANISFTIDCPIPLSSIVVYRNEEDDTINEIPYTKLGDTYNINISENGTYIIVAKSLNNSIAKTSTYIDTLDNTPPTIHMENAVFFGKSITFEISDDQSGINYDNLYSVDDSGRQEHPQSLDESSGTVTFRFENTNSLTIHVEDMSGNSIETTIES